ncbi:amidohydrolase [Phenylobacterium sp. J426]|uniref:amidohydrolase n=1 Tax=Phenylobacterium sp. J426 TaxID=2898439 RepID=UPI00215147CC|nr:amidohydrolase [Phenylobacterium sp. J426]MCR5876454.1 amidohydrolase [Phenylobacterium sp. J426]
MHTAKRILAAVTVSLALAAAGSGWAAEAQVADLVLINGKVITVDANATVAQAVAVKGNRIVAVGGDVSAWRGPQTRVIDLKGRPLLPGFIDAHSHVEGMAGVESRYIKIQAPPLKDGKAIISELKKAQAKLPPGAWLVGQGTYNQVMPTRAELDKAFPDNPVRLIWSAHDSLINHKAAQVMGLTKDWPDPGPGHSGHYERLPNGEVFIVRDAPAPWPAQDAFAYPELKEAVRGILDDFYLKKGVTTVSDLSSPTAYRAMQDLRKEGRLPTRVRMNYFVRDPKMLDMVEASGVTTGLGDDWLRFGAVKFFADGVWGTTAAVYKPFWNGSGTTWIPNNTGGVTYDQETLNSLVLRAYRNGWQVEVHANGDRAQDMVLTAYEAAQAAAPRQDARLRIEHFAHFLVQDPQRTEERLQRMKRSNVIISPQVAFLWRLTDVNVREPDVKFFPMKTIIDRGFRPAGGVDTIGTQNFATYPMFSIERAVNRDTKFGTIVQPEEAISVMDGIRMFTIWSAEANFLEKDFGSIEVGKVADLVVLAQDPLTAPKDKLADIPVDMTILDGKVAYAR